MADKLEVNFSDSYGAKLKRISRLPSMMEDYFSSATKKDASNLVNNFQEGIRKNNFKLVKLEDGTVKRKRSQSLSKPHVPLYGKGDEKKKNSYINMLRVRKIKNGYIVRPSVGKHYSGVALRMLYNVHEFGAVIKKGEGLIRIPPRPAFLKAFVRLLNQRRELENTPEVKKAIAQFINQGKSTIIKNKVAFFEKESQGLIPE